MRKSSQRSRFRGACIAGVVTAIVLGFVGVAPTTAGADEPDNAAQNCLSALQGESDADLVLSTDPEDGPLAPGDELEVTLTWGTAEGEDVWSDIAKIYLCMTVDGVLDEGSIFEEKPGVDDGTASATFTVPEGAEEVCVHGRLSGNPGPDNTSDDTHKTDQTCFPIGEEQTCEEGQLGTFPDCEDPCVFDETIPADDPACVEPECEEGQLGTFPDCEDPCVFDETIPASDPACEEDVLPSTETPTDPVDPATPEAEVAGTVTLPVTGVSSVPLAALAIGLIALGRILVTRSRKTIG